MEERIIDYDDIKPIYTIDTEGKIKNIKTCKYLKYAASGAGYYTVGLQRNDNSRKTYNVHKLFAETFLEKDLYDTQVNHINKDRTKNTLDNLEWCTQAENLLHEFTNNDTPIYAQKTDKWGKVSYGSSNGMSKINEEQCHFICKKLSEGYNRHEIKEMCDFNVSLDIIRFIEKRRRWQHISKDYKW